MGLDERWADILAQLIVHTLVAALVVEALARTWRVRHPEQVIALRLVAIAYPLVLFPALVLFFPSRLDPAFRDAALLSGRRWHEVPFHGLDLYRSFVVGFASLGALLFLVDLLGLAQSLRRGRPAASPPDEASAARLAEALAPLAARPGGAPVIRFIDRPAAMLFCAGVRPPVIYVSRGALARLDPAELAAALAHEAAHAERRDPERSWVVMGLRSLMLVNPTFQVLARALARDAERLADERGVELGADRLALASAILKLHRAGGAGVTRRTLVFGGALAGPLRRARSHDVEHRARALLQPPSDRLSFGRLRLALAAGAVTSLLYFVT
jgi:BlaR1 peptidase M56